MPYTDQFKLRLWAYQDGKCPLCGQAILLGEALDTELVNIDHIMPRALGGSGRRENLQLVHVPCNLARGHSYEGGGSHRIPGHSPLPKPRREVSRDARLSRPHGCRRRSSHSSSRLSGQRPSSSASKSKRRNRDQHNAG